MTGPAVQSGSAFGGFIEGVTGGFQQGTEFRRRRQLEQQVAEQLRLQTERQGVEDARQTTLFDQSQEDRELALDAARRAQELEDLQLFLDTGLTRLPSGPGAPQKAPDAVSNLRSGVGDTLQGPQPVRGVPGVIGAFPSPTTGPDPRAVGANLTGPVPQVDPNSAGVEQFGFTQTGPSSTDLVNQALAAPDPQAFLRENPRAFGALDDEGLLQTVVDKFTPVKVNINGVERSFASNDEAVSFRNMLALEASRDPITPAALRAEFNKDKVITDAAQIASAFERLKSVATAPPSGANDIAIIFSYMKMVDPGSTVREGEFATAEQAQGVPDRVVALYNKLLEGTRLGAEGSPTRESFLQSANLLLEGQRVVLGRVMDRYRGLAERANIDPVDVLFDPFGPGSGVAPPGGGPGGDGEDEQPGNPFPVPGR